VIAAAALATTGFFLVVVGAGLRAQRRRVATGRAGMIGAHAVTVEPLRPEGRVRMGDEIWNAVANQDVETGVEVEIAGVDGLKLRVRPPAKEGRS
jgi:membrane-bound serine protease (ClpP class)